MYRLGFRRSPLPQPNRQEDDSEHSEKLALPVLKRFVPELRRLHVPRDSNPLAGAVLPLLLVVPGTARRRMTDKRDQEQKQEGETQRVLVYGEPPAPGPHRPRRARVVPVRVRIFFHRVGAVVLLRFRRAALVEEYRENDVEPHLQELALPVLEDGLAELARAYECSERDLALAMLSLLVVMGHPAGEHVPDARSEEQDEEHDGKVVLTPHAEALRKIRAKSSPELERSGALEAHR